MPLAISTFASGDTDYIAKHNTNNSNIKAAIDALQSAIGGLGGEGTTAVFYEGIFSSNNAIIGSGSYLPSDSATAHQLDVAAGHAYAESADAAVTKSIVSAISFSGQTTGTYYIHVDSSGEPYFNATSSGALYVVDYDDASGDFSNISRVGNLVESADDQNDARTNLWSLAYDTLDKRIDGAENAALSILSKTAVATDLTLTDYEAFEHHVLLIDDGPQTADIIINVPAAERVYTVLNNASSTYKCEILPDAGTGYEVVGNYFSILYCDGLTVVPIFELDRTTGVSPSQEFTSLSDTPNNYSGEANRIPQVNSGETGLVFIDVDDVPADAATTIPISSNWAYDHEQAADPHAQYLTPAEGNAAYEPLDATILKEADVDDTPVDAATTAPISSNWAYDHENAADPHPGYLTQTEADGIYEDDLGNPASDGYHLTSTAAGARTWTAVPAGGNVAKVGTPVDNEVGVWTGDGTIEGDTNFQWTGTSLNLAKDIRIAEAADHSSTPAAGFGYVWVKNTEPTTIIFTDDDGTDHTLGTGGGGTAFVGTVSDQIDAASASGATDTLYMVTTGATNATFTLNLPSPDTAGQVIGVMFHAQNAAGDKVVIHLATSDEIDGSTADLELTKIGEYLYLIADGDGVNWYTLSAKFNEPYYIGGFYPGAPTASAKMMVHVFPEAVDYAINMPGSYGTAETAATAQTDFDVQEDGVSVGTMRFAAAATTATFIMASETNYAAGEKMQLIAPATPDATLADIAWSFEGAKA